MLVSCFRMFKTGKILFLAKDLCGYHMSKTTYECCYLYIHGWSKRIMGVRVHLSSLNSDIDGGNYTRVV